MEYFIKYTPPAVSPACFFCLPSGRPVQSVPARPAASKEKE